MRRALAALVALASACASSPEPSPAPAAETRTQADPVCFSCIDAGPPPSLSCVDAAPPPPPHPICLACDRDGSVPFTAPQNERGLP